MGQFFKATLLNLLTLCVSLILFASYFSSTAVASPVAATSDHGPHNLFKRYSGTPTGKEPEKNDGGDTSDYPTDDEITAAFVPPAGAFVFFSKMGSEVPYKYATNTLGNGAVVLSGAYPKGYVGRGKKPKRSQAWFLDFLDRISGLYADKAVAAGNRVYFVGVWDENGNPVIAKCSIWNRIELPTLIAGSIPITFVDGSNVANTKDYPVPDPPVFSPIIPRELLEKRGSGHCFDWEGDREDPADPDSDQPIGLDYYPGNCGVHLEQFQKNEGPKAGNGNGATSDYRFTIQVKDDQQVVVGMVQYYDAPGGQGVNVDSGLPYVFIATAGKTDDEAVSFAYAGQTWKSSDAQCSQGGYDSGSNLACFGTAELTLKK